MTVRVAAVSYLNALPLTHGLPWPVAAHLPAQLGGAPDLDLILASVVVAHASPEWEILWEAPAIGCCGAVGSVRLDFAPGQGLQTARRYGLSPESRTSNVLLRLLLEQYWERRDVEFVDPIASDIPPDAQLVIGDRALVSPPAADAIDLGAAWHAWTGLPFVFACWMRRRGANVPDDVTTTLCATRDRNLRTLPTLLQSHGLATVAMLHYFTQHLAYDFGAEQHRGLRRFFAELGEPSRGKPGAN